MRTDTSVKTLRENILRKKCIGSTREPLSNERNNTLLLAIRNLDSAVALSAEIRFLDNLQKAYKNLSEAYGLLHNYQAAFLNYINYSNVKDSVYSLEKQTDIFNLQKRAEIEERNREQLKEKEDHERRIYLQMAGICMFILVLIILLLFLRKRRVKARIIDILSTFSVLIIFEFINLLIHTKIERLTHHNMVLTLLCLLGVAAIVIPLHHSIEHWLKKKLVH